MIDYDPIQHAPGVMHPAFEQWPILKDWIEGRGELADRYNVKYPIMPPVRFSFEPEPEPIGPGCDIGVITKHKCAGLAPYVGRPFVYWWWVGVDQLGRAIASEARIKHTISEFEWEVMYS